MIKSAQFCICVALLFSSSAVESQDFAPPMPMKFEYRSAGNAIEALWISATGTITKSTPQHLRTFLTQEGSEGGKIVFDSPGGDLIAGLEIGRILREYRLASYVGRSVADPDVPSRDTILDGICTSACAYAFLGGIQRSRNIPWATESSGSLLGFHRFYDARGDLGIISKELARVVRDVSLSEAQIISGLIAAYLSDVGVDSKLLSYASEAGPSEMRFLTDEEAISLAVFTTDGFGAWFLEPYGAGLVAASREGDPLTLTTQITAYCRNADKKPTLMITSDWSSREPSPLPDKSPPSEQSVSGAIIRIDDDEFVIPSESVKRADQDALTFYRVLLPELAVERLLAGEQFGIQIAGPRAEGVHEGGGALHDLDRKMIRLAYRNCI